jgi:ferric iron reductase protein FhuF
MLALLSEERAVSLAPEHFRVEFHETGRAACFWIDVHSAGTSPAESAQSRMEKLVTTALQPVVQALEATGDINGKLIWSNTGYLINWYLGEMRTLVGDEKVAALRQLFFFKNSYQAVRITRCGVRWFYVKGSSCAAPAASAIACRTYSSAGTVR